ncbi:hypothetical protein RchiOBHm_Chr5g0023591 [Rosa chinensis]|uniref:Uncharacterized protein n=1 Tax=Rosa chinensis TaxID=74649 RepID=A0A2P6Q843_ROSCH|nr:hypothetical protein RchiOBHm_Chr5g0023591 [Rosa chinensis]
MWRSKVTQLVKGVRILIWNQMGHCPFTCLMLTKSSMDLIWALFIYLGRLK